MGPKPSNWVATSFAPGASRTLRTCSVRWAGGIALALLLVGPVRAIAAAEGSVRAKSKSYKQLASKALWKSGATVVRFENMEGIAMIPATLTHLDGRDTTGVLVLDTGAGYVALDAGLAQLLGIDAPVDSGRLNAESSVSQRNAIGLADRPLPRLEIGRLQFDQVSPILTIDGSIIRQVTDRPVFGLLGARPLTTFAILVDYQRKELGFISMADSANHRARTADSLQDTDPVDTPGLRAVATSKSDQDARVRSSRLALTDAIHANARPIAFRLRGDDKILVSVRVANPDKSSMSDTMTLIVDTGATKTALFAPALAEKATQFERWRTLRGLTAPTLMGSAEARVARTPLIEVLRDSGNVATTDVDVAIIESPLAAALSADVGEPVHGLLGYSFLRRFRFVIDYPNEVLWLEPILHTRDERLYEYTHVGLQIERRGTALSIVGVATGSPADLAGIIRADEVISIDGTSATALDVLEASRRLEGRAGTAVVLRVRRGDAVRTIKLQRRRLL